ncbi:NifB/NifX family molybdenum-iron cluster-binding protein [Myxococcota bacterium]
MKVALTVWDGRVSPVFDVSRVAVILTVENGSVVSRCRENIDAPIPSLKLDRLMELGVETLICGAISEPLHRELTIRGVRVLGFVAGKIDEVEQAFTAGQLPTPALSMPGCCNNRLPAQCHDRRGNRWGPRRRS